MKQNYDICIVGAGIQGTGIALLASLQGYSVLLVEQQSCAWATSSRSSKLIHGGLRYLQTAQLKLVRECLKEREWMLNNIPELVKSNWFYIPIYQQSRYRPWQIHCGLFLYRLLAGFSQKSRFKKLTKIQWSKLTDLKQEKLQAVFAYQDAQTDDKVLSQAILQQAINNGCDYLDNCKFINAQQQTNNYDINLIQQNDNKKTIKINSRLIVNASGPWANDVIDRISSKQTLSAFNYDLIQGSHLVCSPQLSHECFYLESPDDQRAIFVLPWQGKSLIGTTETLFKEDPANPSPLPSEVEYLSKTVKHYFPDYCFEIEQQFAGLRVLPQSQGKAFKRSRETHISTTENVISIYGGKLTSWRSSSKKVLTQINKTLKKSAINKRINIDEIRL